VPFLSTLKINGVPSCMKMMEIPATGALLLANDDVAEALADLGFQPFYNYIAFNNQTLDSIVDWVLDDKNRAEVDSIRRNGQVCYGSAPVAL
jgi:hypothetical protein